MVSLPTSFIASEIRSGLSHQARLIEIEITEETASTNTDLLERIATLTEPVLRIAEKQTAGRGRNGKVWQSDAGSLTFSLAWPLHCDTQQLAGVSLVIGIALAQALRAMDVPVLLKWPNDLLKAQKKMAGILVERADLKNRSTSPSWIIVGIGMNLALSDELEAQLGQPAADSRWLSRMDKNRLMSTLVNAVTDALIRFEKEGLSVFIPAWQALHAFANQTVRLVRQGLPDVTGKAIGIDALGRLLLENEHGVSSFSAGEVSLRLIEG